MTALLIILTGLLVLLNAFFVVAEYALVRSRRARLETIAEEGSRGARMALVQLDQIGDYLAACQVGVTMASIGIGALGEPAISHALEPAFGSGLGHDLALAIAAVIAYLLITFAQSTIGEVVPKLWAIQRPEHIARFIAPVMRLFMLLFRPLIATLNGSAQWILRRFGVDPSAVEESGTPEELRAMIEISHTGGQIDEGEAEMLAGVFDLHEQDARQVMTPIPAVVTVDVAQDVGEALQRAISTGHTRLLVTEDDDEDRIKGIVHVNQLVRLLMDGGESSTFAGVVREAPIVPETKPLDDLLADLQRERTELAVVIDEYGRTVGIVTIEDIIEEVVGEISDETDPAAGSIRRLANGDWYVRGHVAVADLEDHGLQLPLDSDAYNSIGGLVFTQLGRLPRRGDTVVDGDYSIRVEAVRENRVEAVRIRALSRHAE